MLTLLDQTNTPLKKRNLLLVIVAAPELILFCNTVNDNSKIYIGLGTKEIENEKFSTSLIGNREKYQKRLLNLT